MKMTIYDVKSGRLHLDRLAGHQQYGEDQCQNPPDGAPCHGGDGLSSECSRIRFDGQKTNMIYLITPDISNPFSGNWRKALKTAPVYLGFISLSAAPIISLKRNEVFFDAAAEAGGRHYIRDGT